MDEKRTWIPKLQEEAEIPEIVWQKAEQAFQTIRKDEEGQEWTGKRQNKRSAGSRKKRVFTKKKIAVVILAATLMISSLTVGAAAYFHWNDSFSKQYHTSPEIEKKLNDSNTAKEMNQYAEHDGIRIEAVQSVADNSIAHIILKIQGTEGFELNKNMNFGDIEVKSGDKKLAFFGNFLTDPMERDLSEGLEYEILIQDTGKEGVLNQEIQLIFHQVIDEYEGKINRMAREDYPVVVDSTWELDMILDNEDNGKDYEVNQQIPGTEAFVRKIHLSSVSYTLDLDWTLKKELLPCTYQNGEQGTFEHIVNPPSLVGVVYEDGSSRESACSALNGEFINDEKTQYREYGYNPQIIDYENVSELIFGTEEGLVKMPVEKE
ncbi:MAG: DUF4179 domain-containing protein [Faecalicatena sp.]|uniref:DUF4179 domain-containing protein n=1 Tax=Faecalicatena sp. TaxID=2005360 RepID=UPI00258ED452|nr:DUF4179 domain-containing protein [Faecalicatena sp.]MCI6466721.1 DUF4179 domain-containing protein [Faecalicatena sp.]MCI7181960.1 DUF4179 domain-containing protein [Lachnospiraceae bacterium]MDY5619111.1 DUF4179 domain-containing protein [Lachnospiraceae bacterium]